MSLTPTSPLSVDDSVGPTSTLQDALGVTGRGTCLRHPNCPVLNLKTHTVTSCRVCFSEEKSAGMKSKSFAAVVQQLQRLNEENELADPIPAHEKETTPVLPHEQSFDSVMKRLSQVQNWTLRQKEKEVMSLQLTIHRLEQKLNDAEMKVIDQKDTIRALRKTIQQDLKLIKSMATQKDREQQLNKSAHSPNKHHSASLLGDDESEQDLDEFDEDVMLYESPIKSPSGRPNHANANAPPRRNSSPPSKRSCAPKAPTRTSSASGLAFPNDMNQRLQSQLEQMKRESKPSLQPTLSLTAVSRGEDDSESEEESQKSGSYVPRSEYWSDADLNFANDPTRIFASFRGGLLDIPKSPPPNCHQKEKPKPKLKLKVKVDSEKNLHLKVPSMRNLTRTSSEMTDATGHTAYNGEYDSSNIPLNLLAQHINNVPFDQSVTSTPVSVDTSVSTTTSDVLKRRGKTEPPPPPLSLLQSASVASDSSASHKLGSPPHQLRTSLEARLFPLPNEVEIRRDAATIVTATYSIDTLETHKTNDTHPTLARSEDEQKTSMTMAVSRASCCDKYGDPGTYTGDIIVTEGLPHGKGKMIYDSGRIYDGEWVHGHWNGKGKLLNPNGDTYEGEFVFDARHGQGIYKWDNGDVYVGSFSQDKRHGHGKFSFHNGNVYDGEFCDGMFEGVGKYSFKDGYYEGEWKQGRYDGNGELKYCSGAKYTGEFRNSVAHGFGLEVTADGKKRRGVWEHGEPVEYYERT